MIRRNRMLILMLGYLFQLNTIAYAVAELIEVRHHQHALDVEKPEIMLANVVMYFNGTSKQIVPTLVSKTKTKGTVHEYLFLVPQVCVKSDECKQMIARMNSLSLPYYKFNLSTVDSQDGLHIKISLDDQIIGLQEWPLTSIKGKSGIEFRFINKKVVNSAKEHISGKRTTQLACNKKMRVVLDPGHGGKDRGAQGAKNLYEKDVSLSIACMVKDILSSHNTDVCLTRSKDVYIDLDERTLIANSYDADIVVSIHANGALNKMAHGIETFYPELYAEKPLLSTVLENETIVSEWCCKRQAKSKNLATVVQKSICSAVKADQIDVYDRKTKSAISHLLVGTSRPAILVEVGFITHEMEGALLGKLGYQEKIAHGIAQGILSYLVVS